MKRCHDILKSLKGSFFGPIFLTIFSMTLSLLTLSPAAVSHADDGVQGDSAAVTKLMSELKQANKKTKWSETIFTEKQGWKSHGTSVEGRPLLYWTCGDNNTNTTLMLSAVHGDEVTPVYFGFRLVSWVKGEPDLCKNYRVIVAPLINPDGVLSSRPTRTNSRGVDLNRNFPTKDFDDLAVKLWKTKFKSETRRYPGEKGGSEPETKFQEWLIDTFKPDKILTVHSPLNFYDYDGPESDELKQFTNEYVRSCKELRTAVRRASENYNFLNYGFFPGSLGNYAGKERGIPTLTLELPTVDAKKAKSYFEQLKKGTRELVMYQVKGKETAKNGSGSTASPAN